MTSRELPKPIGGRYHCERCGFKSASGISYEYHLQGCAGWSTIKPIDGDGWDDYNAVIHYLKQNT